MLMTIPKFGVKVEIPVQTEVTTEITTGVTTEVEKCSRHSMAMMPRGLMEAVWFKDEKHFRENY